MKNEKFLLYLALLSILGGMVGIIAFSTHGTIIYGTISLFVIILSEWGLSIPDLKEEWKKNKRRYGY